MSLGVADLDGRPEPLTVDDVILSVQVGITFMTAGCASYRVGTESLSTLVSVV